MAGLHTNPHPEPLRSSPVGLPLHEAKLHGWSGGAGRGDAVSEGVGGFRPPLLQENPSPLSANVRWGDRDAWRRRGGQGGEGETRGVSLLALVAVGLMLAFSTGPASAQEPTPSDDEVNAIARQLYCPVCENVPLDVCPTQACAQWRATIREKLGLGWTEQQIKDYFVAQYGDRVLAAPSPSGLNWLVYLLPPLVLTGGGLLLWQTMRRWRRAAEQAPTPAALSETDPYVQRLEEELKRRG